MLITQLADCEIAKVIYYERKGKERMLYQPLYQSVNWNILHISRGKELRFHIPQIHRSLFIKTTKTRATSYFFPSSVIAKAEHVLPFHPHYWWRSEFFNQPPCELKTNKHTQTHTHILKRLFFFRKSLNSCLRVHLMFELDFREFFSLNNSK